MRNQLIVDQLLVELGKLKVGEANILDKLKVARAQELSNRSRDEVNSYKYGDRVFITNQVRISTNSSDKDQRGIITLINSAKVHLTTDNKLEIWRLANNVSFL